MPSAKRRLPYERIATRPLVVERLEERALLASGLTAQYFDTASLGTLKLTRVDAAIDFDWGSGSPDSSIGADTFSIRWTGRIQAQYSEPYTFYVRADDGIRLWIDQRLIVDNWSDQSATETSGQIALAAGQWYDLKLEYYDNTGSAAVRLSWASPSQGKQVVPQAMLSTASGSDDRGSIQQEIWLGVGGDSVASLLASPSYPAHPSARGYLTAFESVQPNWADSYGERLRGYLVPDVTGSYVLAVSGDESAQLYLDTTGTDPGHPSLVAWTDAATGFRDFTSYATQQSAPMSLIAGQKYYIEALHKEGTGNDHLSVGWLAPGASQISVISGDVLVPYGVDSVLPAQGNILDTLAAGHLRLMTTPERFEWLKQQVAAAGQLQTWYNAIKTSADAMLTAALPQYVQDNRGTILDISRSVVDHIYKLALVYRIGGDTRYAERAWQELEAAAAFPDWHPAHFLDTAEMTHAFAVGYDWLYDYWSVDRRTVISTAIVTKGLNQSLTLYRNNSSWVASTSNNWNLVCNGGMVLGALAVADEQPTLAAEILAKAIPSAAAMMRHFTADAGAWYEGPGYWDYSTSYNSRMLAALETALGSDFGLGQTPGVSETGEFAVYNTGPAKLSFNFADAGAGVMRGPQLFWYARRYDRPLLAWYERTNAPSTPNPLDLLWYDGRGADPAANALPTSLQYRGDPTAYATQDVVDLRTSWSDPTATFVGFKAGKVGDSHGHLDAGSFVFDALGQRWAYDLGGDDYALPAYFGSTRWNYYRLRAEGHNTLVINPSASADQKANAITTLFRNEASAEGSVSVADLTAAYQGLSRVWRGVAVSNRDGSLLVQDEIISSTAAEVWWFMHVKLSASQVQISDDGASAMLTSGTNRLWVRVLDGSGAQLTLVDPVPLATSPNPSGQNANVGYKKLAIHLSNVTNRTLAVWMVPLAAGENPPVTAPTVSALGTWHAQADNRLWLGDLDLYQADDAADTPVIDPAWQSQLAGLGFAQAGFDTVGDNQVVGLTFNFNVPVDQQVVGAILTLGMRATGGSASADVLYLDTIANSYSYGSLGWTTPATTPTARSLDLGNRLSLLQDGKLNLAVQKNTAVDWASLSLKFGPLGQFTPQSIEAEADASVRDGAYASVNFGAGDLAVQKDTTGTNQESYLRFNLAGITQTVASAVLRLTPTAVGGIPENQLAFVSDDSWSETGLTWNNKPSSGTAIASWAPTAGITQEFDLTSLVQAAVAGDKLLSLRLLSTVAGAGLSTDYASRENVLQSLRPQLLLSTFASGSGAALRIDGDRDFSNQADTIRLICEAGYLNVFVNHAGDVPDLRRDLASLQQLTIASAGGNDAISLDFTSGMPAAASISVEGGTGNDTVSVAGGQAATYTGTQIGFGGLAVACSDVEYGAFSTASLTISAATLRLGADNAIGASTDLVVSDAGTLDLNGHTTTAHAVTLADGVILGGTLSGTSFTVQNGTVSAALAGAANLTKNSRGKVVLAGANTYTGTTTVYEGVLNIRSGQSLGSGSAAVTVSCDGATSRYSALEFEGADFTVDGKPLNTTGAGYGGLNTSGVPYSANGALRNISGNHAWNGAVTLTGGGGGSTYQSDSGMLTINGSITPNTTNRTLTLQGSGSGVLLGTIQNGSTLALPVTKSGSGTWTLAGANTYTGTTAVNGGTLLVTGSLTGGSVTVGSSGTLGGTGSIGGAVTNSGTLSPGVTGAAGTLTIGSLTLKSTSILKIDLASLATSDLIVISGALTVDGFKADVTDIGGMQTGAYTVLDYATQSGNITGYSVRTAPSGYRYQLSHDVANTSIDLKVLNDAPTISAIANQTMNEDGTLVLSFTVGDTETAASQLLVIGSSSDETLIPGANITFGGSGTNRTISLSPATNRFGTGSVTIVIGDGAMATASLSFQVIVMPVNDSPTATVALTNHRTLAKSLLTANVVVVDVDGDLVTLTYVWKVNQTVCAVHSNRSAATDTFDLGQVVGVAAGDVVTVEVTPNDGTVAGDVIADLATVVAPPRVTGAYLRGNWQTVMLQAMADAGAGDAMWGFRLIDGAAQVAKGSAVVWGSTDRLTLRFSAAVNVGQGSLALYDSQNREVASVGFTKMDDQTAEWRFAPLTANKYWFQLRSAATADLDGFSLDGEWVTSQSTYANSGDGMPGGDLNFRFNVLPGDANSDDAANVSDVIYLRSRLGAPIGPTTWRYDLNASGGINVSDVISLRAWLGVSLSNFSDPSMPTSPTGLSEAGAANVMSTDIVTASNLAVVGPASVLPMAKLETVSRTASNDAVIVDAPLGETAAASLAAPVALEPSGEAAPAFATDLLSVAAPSIAVSAEQPVVAATIPRTRQTLAVDQALLEWVSETPPNGVAALAEIAPGPTSAEWQLPATERRSRLWRTAGPM